jgi:outer membrane lipase/esterase
MPIFSALPRWMPTSLKRSLALILLALGAASGALLSGCGSGSTVEPLKPARVASFGDGWSDIGQTGGRFTVNDGSASIWVERVASSYGNTLTAKISGGLGFAQGNSLIDTGAHSIADQITAFLGANVIDTRDLLIIDPGVAQLIALAAANPTDNAALNTAATTSGQSLAAQVLRLKDAGAKHIVIASAPDLGKTPFAAAQTAPRTAALTAATRAFNDSLKVALSGITAEVLYIDNEAYVNILHATPGTLGAGGTSILAACAPATFNTNSCTTATLNTGITTATYNLSLYADDRHLTPAAHRLLGDSAYNKIKSRW